MNDTKQIVCYVLLFSLLTSLPLHAQGRYSEFEKDLQLSESQRTRIEDTKRRYMGQLRGLNQEAVNKRLELRDLKRNPSANPEKRERLQRELRAIESSRHNLYNRYRSDLSRVLNQEQKNRYNSFVDSERRARMSRPGPLPANRSTYPSMRRYPRYYFSDRPIINPFSQNRPMDTPSPYMHRPMSPFAGRPIAPPSMGRPSIPPPSMGHRPGPPPGPGRGHGR